MISKFVTEVSEHNDDLTLKGNVVALQHIKDDRLKEHGLDEKEREFILWWSQDFALHNLLAIANVNELQRAAVLTNMVGKGD